MKKWCLMLVLFTALFVMPVAAQTGTASEPLSELSRLRDIGELERQLPQQSKKYLNDMGVKGAETGGFISLTYQKILGVIGQIVTDHIKKPVTACLMILFVILLCALLETYQTSLTKETLGGVYAALSTVAVCLIVIIPVSELVTDLSGAIAGCANFMLVFIPVFGAILLVGGQAFSAGVYNGLILGIAQLGAQLAKTVITPLISAFLALCVTAGISPRGKLKSISEFVYSTAMMVLKIIATVFVALLTIQGLVGTAADTVGSKTAKFLIGSFIPVIGTTLAEAYNSVLGSLRLLKMTVGMYGVISACVLLLPTLIKLVLWMAGLNLCACAGDLFELKSMSALLRSVLLAVKAMLGILALCALFLIISTVIMLMIGGGGTS